MLRFHEYLMGMMRFVWQWKLARSQLKVCAKSFGLLGRYWRSCLVISEICGILKKFLPSLCQSFVKFTWKFAWKKCQITHWFRILCFCRNFWKFLNKYFRDNSECFCRRFQLFVRHWNTGWTQKKLHRNIIARYSNWNFMDLNKMLELKENAF